MTETANAEYQAGLAFLHGQDGNPEDFLQAAQKFTLAAYANHRPSQVAIAEMYLFGRGVPKSLVHAHAWIIVALTCRNRREEKDLKKKKPNPIIKQATKIQQDIYAIARYGTAYGFGHGGSCYAEGDKLAMEIYREIHNWNMLPEKRSTSLGEATAIQGENE